MAQGAFVAAGGRAAVDGVWGHRPCYVDAGAVPRAAPDEVLARASGRPVEDGTGAVRSSAVLPPVLMEVAWAGDGGPVYPARVAFGTAVGWAPERRPLA